MRLDTETGLKRCSSCHEHQPPEKFSTRRSELDGLCPLCRECRSREGKLYYQENREAKNRYEFEYRQRNPEKNRKRRALWLSANRDKHRQYNREWSKSHAQNRAISWQNRRARMKADGGIVASQDWTDIKSLFSFCCISCGKQEPDIALTMDHVLPISQGGSHNWDNIQPLCSVCNCLKGGRFVDYRPYWGMDVNAA